MTIALGYLALVLILGVPACRRWHRANRLARARAYLADIAARGLDALIEQSAEAAIRWREALPAIAEMTSAEFHRLKQDDQHFLLTRDHPGNGVPGHLRDSAPRKRKPAVSERVASLGPYALLFGPDGDSFDSSLRVREQTEFLARLDQKFRGAARARSRNGGLG